MVIISPAVDDADPLAAANGARAPRSAPAANHFDPAAAWSLFDVVHGTTTATADVVAGTTPWWSSQPPNYAASTTATSSGTYDVSSSFPPPPSFQSHGDDLACYVGSIMDTSFPPAPAPPALCTQPELSYSYYPQEPFQSCFAAPLAVEPTTIRPQPQVPTTETASMPPSSLHYPQTQQATTTGSESGEEASPALADTQQKAQDETRPAPRRRGRPSKRERALAVSEPPVSKPTKRVAVGRNRAVSSTSQMMTSSATTAGTATTMSSAAGQVPEQAGGSSSSTGSTSDQQTAACTSTNRPLALLYEERRCGQLQRPAVSNSAPAPAGVVVEGHREQAAIAPPELTMVTEPQYADTSAVGVRFHPTDQQLIGYLRIKYAGQEMPVKFFKDFDVYQAHPMAIKGACGESQDGCWYAFSPRDRKYRNGKRPARSVFAESGDHQVGFWKSNSRLGDVRAGGTKDGAVIGRMTSLTFQLGRQPRGKQTGWKMKEYTIPENQHQPDGSAMLLNDWVVCKLFYKERAGCTNTESMQGEEDMQPQMVPAAHQASDYSEQDLCVEDYLVCDVGFAQQKDAANCTI